MPTISRMIRRLWLGPVLNTNSLHNSDIHGYIPMYRKEGEAVEDLIREIAHGLISRLDEIEATADFDTLTHLDDIELKNEALFLQSEIRQLKASLQNI